MCRPAKCWCDTANSPAVTIRRMGRRPKNSRPRRFAAGCIAPWCRRFSCPRLFMSKGSPWENGRVESFDRTLRDERLNRERFLSLAEARGVIDRWRRDYHHYRPHRSLNCQTPAATAAGGAAAGRPTASLRQHSASPPDSLSCAATTTGGSTQGLLFYGSKASVDAPECSGSSSSIGRSDRGLTMTRRTMT